MAHRGVGGRGLENGVNVRDFQLSKHDLTISKFDKISKFVVGYYGVVSELLDYDILRSLLDIDHVQLVLIGPENTFHETNRDTLKSSLESLKEYRNFTNLEFVKYAELKYYLKDFDVCIIPFKINEITDSISPLKLFEYMTSGKPIVCTPTKELMKFKDRVLVRDTSSFAEAIRQIIREETRHADYSDILEEHDWDNLVSKYEEFMESLGDRDYIFRKRNEIIDILNVNFYDWDGKTLYQGGAERYVTDLAKLLECMGHEARLIQNANNYFEREYQGIKVIGIPARAAWENGKLYDYYLNNFAHSKYTICSPLDISCLQSTNRVVGINHGIHWDGINNNLDIHEESRFKHIFDALKNIEKGVCVDTNFINWVRTYDRALSEKLLYIPNYYDEQQFKFNDKCFLSEEIIILYPRRLYGPRGFYLVTEVMDNVLRENKNIKFHFVGQSSSPDTEEMEKYLKKYPENVIHYSLDISEMHIAYERSQIVLIPSVNSEGTSLSCIEAAATNNAIITTNVGGLPNLIIDGFNGLLISPDVKDLAQAVNYLINNRDERIHLAKNALETAKAFRKSRWDEKWLKVFSEFIN